MTDSPSKSTSRIQTAVRTSARSMVRSVAATGAWLKRAIWIWPIIAALILGSIGWFMRSAVEHNLQTDLASKLKTLLDTDVAALRFWMRSQQMVAESAAADPQVIAASEKLVALAAKPNAAQLDLLQSAELKEIREQLKAVMEARQYIGFLVVDPSQRIVAATRNELIAVTNPRPDQPYARRALDGKATVSPPRKSTVLLPTANGELQVGIPTMFAWAPIRSQSGQVIAALGLRIRPEQEFMQILSITRAGKTGETYAVNREGLMLSGSRFDDDLRGLGLIAEDQDSILNVQLRDPGVDMTQGGRPAGKRSELSLTLAGQEVAAGKSNVNVSGYNDYRGVPVVGAWTWLPEYEMGVVTEQDSAEAFSVLYVLRAVFWSMFALLGMASLAIFAFTLGLARLDRQARQAALEAKRLGQYTLDQKLGEGGMGVVYRAHHAMLHRPTAVKFLGVDKTNEQTIARFEREVQLTSQLCHPNTVAIFDFGRTPEGIFYYAMEYLDGINLEDLLQKFGPQPAGRVISILRQVCGSLAEAHSIGLIHRDIKPANIVLTQRGGIPDFVKLLDFGLVRAVDEQQQARLTTAGALAGTPLYLSPEAINQPDDVDFRSDLYALGAVGYFLVTGTPVFDGRSVIDILNKHTTAAPEPPSQRLGKPIPVELEALVLACLAKKPADRPASAADLAKALERCVGAHWANEEAQAWWSQFRPGAAKSPTSAKVRTETLGETIVTSP